MSGPVRDKRWVRKAIALLEDKKVEDVRAYDLKAANPFVDYALVATCNNPAHLSAAAQSLAEAAPEATVEGEGGSGWVIVDAGRVVVHLQSPTLRDFYRLDQMWETSPVKL